MDILKQSGRKKHLPAILYVFLIVLGINILWFAGVSFDLLVLLMIICYPIKWITILFAIIYYCITNKKIYGFWCIIISTILLVILSIYSFSFNQDWSEKKKKKFLLEECSQIDSTNLFVEFTGFTIEELEETFVLQIHENEIVDSLFIVLLTTYNHDSNNIIYSAKIEKPIYIHDTYHFIVNQHIFVLSNMKMTLHPQYTMFSANYGCEMGEYAINGKNIEGRYPNFIKEKE
jgi:hypothetical protein